MPLNDLILELPEFVIQECSGRHEVDLDVRYEGSVACPWCLNQKVRLKGKRLRRVRHLRFGDSLSTLLLPSHKYRCLGCQKYFYQRFPGIMPRARSSEPFRKQVFLNHVSGVSQKTLSHTMKLSSSTIERWTQIFLRLEDAKQDRSQLPRVLGIDEHFFSKKKGYVTTFADLEKHCVYDLMLGRSETSLRGYLERLKGKERVKVILMDLSSTYRAVVTKHFPKAKIVADRFHVIRLINHSLMEVWKQLDPIGRKNRGLLSLMRRHHWKLKPEQHQKLESYLEQHGILKTIYQYKQKLCQLMVMKHQRAKQCKRLIPQFLEVIDDLRAAPLMTLQTLGQTLDSWKEEIVRMWRFTKTNSITEGLHTRMEELQRRAYGFRNFENYRLRVKTLMGYRTFYL